MIKKTFKIFFDIISYLVVLIILLYLFIILYQKVFKKETLPSINNTYLFQIASGSMEDNLLTGDYIFVKKMDDYKVGDIVTFKDGNYYITHRIKKIDGNLVITQGDANNIEDDPIDKDLILGKMIFKAYILTFIIRYKVLFVSFVVAWLLIGRQMDKKRS